MIGTTVGKYRILDRLGRGGMGIVYKALDETLDREVAIKVLNPDVNDAELLKRFRAEAISLARLNHHGIATIYELHRQGDDLLMVMEFVRGETVQALSERLGPLDPPQAAHICVQILNALSHAHRAGIVHRDLKPANVMITETGVVKVMDFGIARMLGAEHFTHAGYMMGTPAYMAPEQVLGQDIDGRADLYSVGVLFYRLLTRELPFQADTAIAMAQKQVAEMPTPLRTFRPNLPGWCESIIEKALAKSPADRFATAEAFRAAILTAVTPVALGELPTMSTPTPSGLLRTADLTLPMSGAAHEPTPTRTLAVPDTGVSASVPALGSGPAAATPGSGVTSPVERTGPTVVLGRGHLISLAAVIVILIGGIAALGYALVKRGSLPFQPAAAPTADSASTSGAEGQPDPQTPPVDGASTPPSGSGTDKPEAAPPLAEASPSRDAATVTAAARPSVPTGKPKVDPKGSQRIGDARPATPSAEPPPPPAPPAPAVAPLTFNDVKVLVMQGNSLRDRDAVLSLAGDHLSVLDRSAKNEILSLPYASITQAYYSRSKQPRWRGADGKEQVASADAGKLGFLRGDRNWLILTTQGSPIFIRLENANLQKVLAAVQERSGVPIQR